jgi:hypothetical protein
MNAPRGRPPLEPRIRALEERIPPTSPVPADRSLVQEIAVPERPQRVIPNGWTRGELLRYQGNSQTYLLFRATADSSMDSIQFGSAQDANDFLGWWYAPLAVRMAEQ